MAARRARPGFPADAQLIILDEPTAALDPRSEAELYARVRELFVGRTVLLISHRFASVRLADHIYVLEEGRVIEHGDHDSLMREAGAYADMFRLQAAAYALDEAEATGESAHGKPIGDRAGCRRRAGLPRGPVSLTRPYVMNDVEIATCLVRGMDPTVRALRESELKTAASGRRSWTPWCRPCDARPASSRLRGSGFVGYPRRRRRGGPRSRPAPAHPRDQPVSGDPGGRRIAVAGTMVARLGLTDWVRVDVADELDIVGPVRHRPNWRTASCGPPMHTSWGCCPPMPQAGRC